MTMLKIKVCGLTDPFNVQEIAGTNPDFMGFIFYPRSIRFVGNKPDESLFSKIPPVILKTGVFVNEELSVIINTVNLYGLDMVQLHGNETAEYCRSLNKSGLSIIKAFGIDSGFSFSKLEKYMDSCEYFLFDAKTRIHGGSGLKFDWMKIYEYHFGKSFFLGGGIEPEDASALRQIRHRNFFAVDINSQFENRPGIKNINKVKDFIKEIKG